MTTDELFGRFQGTVNRHWRVSMDRSGPTPEMIHELVDGAVQYATDHAQTVIARRELREDAAVPVVVAAAVADVPAESDTHRTRTRTRRTT